MKKSSLGLSKYVYTEWLRPIFHYYVTLKKNEAMFEVIIPAMISIICSRIYCNAGKEGVALKQLAELLPTAISILIGFTVMLITLLLTSSGSSIDTIKEKETNKQLHKKPVSLYQGLHIQFSHSLFAEILLLLLIFLYLFLDGLGWMSKLEGVFLMIETYLTLNILLSILRGVANLYFSFYNTNNK